jgi:hypothetical protein
MGSLLHLPSLSLSSLSSSLIAATASARWPSFPYPHARTRALRAPRGGAPRRCGAARPRGPHRRRDANKDNINGTACFNGTDLPLKLIKDKEAHPAATAPQRPWPSPPSSAPAPSRCPLRYPPPRRRHSSPLRPTPVYRASQQQQQRVRYGTDDGAGGTARPPRLPRRSTSPRTTSGWP